MKSIFLALALISTVAHATEDTDHNPCNDVENDVQTLACSAYGKTAAEQLLADNLQSLNERLQTLYAGAKAQLNDITSKIKTAQQLWQKQRDADCAIVATALVHGLRLVTSDQRILDARLVPTIC